MGARCRRTRQLNITIIKKPSKILLKIPQKIHQKTNKIQKKKLSSTSSLYIFLLLCSRVLHIFRRSFSLKSLRLAQHLRSSESADRKLLLACSHFVNKIVIREK